MVVPHGYPLTGGGSLRELHVGQKLAKVVETATPGWPDASYGHAQLFGDLFVWQVVIAHQQAEKTLATLREPLGRHSDVQHLLVA